MNAIVGGSAGIATGASHNAACVPNKKVQPCAPGQLDDEASNAVAGSLAGIYVRTTCTTRPRYRNDRRGTY
ncbi:MAG: hypothetical protein U0521_04480 [Anaerolineae bacterium]